MRASVAYKLSDFANGVPDMMLGAVCPQPECDMQIVDNKYTEN